MTSRILIPTICSLVAAAAAQEAQIGGPIAALVYDAATRSLRPIQGVPGAARLGPALAADLDWADAAPNGKFAVTLRGGKLELLAGLDTADITALPLSDAPADMVSWSADSTAAALYSRASRQLLFAGDLGHVPSIAPLDISSLAGDIRFILADAAAQAVVVGIEGDDAGVYLVAKSDTPRLLARLESPRSAAFLRRNRDIAVVDAATRRIFELRDFRGAAGLLPFADLPEGADPMGIAASASRLFVADRAASSLAVFDLETRQLAFQSPLDAPLALLKATRSDSLFLLGDGAESLFLLDGAREPALYFIPKGKAD